MSIDDELLPEPKNESKLKKVLRTTKKYAWDDRSWAGRIGIGTAVTLYVLTPASLVVSAIGGGATYIGKHVYDWKKNKNQD
jgi:hypothetical protein